MLHQYFDDPKAIDLSTFISKPNKGKSLLSGLEPIGEGLYLMELTENEMDIYNKNIGYKSSGHRTPYSYLFDREKGKIISDNVFRKGGLGGNFKDGYCSLLVYGTLENPDGGISNGCLIDTKGNVVLKQESLNYIYHIGGIIASMGNYLYNLKTNKKILNPNTTKISSDEFLFIETYELNAKYYDPEVAKIQKRGVYKINKFTAEMEFFEKT